MSFASFDRSRKAGHVLSVGIGNRITPPIGNQKLKLPKPAATRVCGVGDKKLNYMSLVVMHFSTK